MNETVARIVDLLFQDVARTDEVMAIYDEVMNNCQERFVDLLARGLTEDEAIAAVVESLKGMEEVLAGYPRKQAADEAPARPQEAILVGSEQAAFSAQSLRRLTVNLLHEDVTIEPSPDSEVHIACNLKEKDTRQVMIVTELVDGELRVNRKDKDGADRVKKHVHINGADIDFFAKDFSFENLGETLGKLMRNIQVSFDGDERVCVQVPDSVRLDNAVVHTTSGNVGIDRLNADRLEVSSRSGDLRVEQSEARPLSRAELRTTSGDAEAWMHADRAMIQSMSGDIRYVGGARELDVNSTSGDVNVEINEGVCERCDVRSISGDVECMGAVQMVKAGTTSGDIELDTASETASFSTVSGDVSMKVRSDGQRSISGNTTSGDVRVSLPSGTVSVDADIHSTSGDVRMGVRSVSGAPLRIGVKTVSGDVLIR